MSVAHEDQTSKEVNSDFKALRIRRLGEGPDTENIIGYSEAATSEAQAPRKAKMSGGPPRPNNGMPPKAGSSGNKPLRSNLAQQ